MSATLIVMYSLEALLRALKDSPMSALRRCKTGYLNSEKAHNEELYDFIGFIVAFVKKLDASPRDTAEFLNDDFWQAQPRAPKAEYLPILACRFMMNVPKPDGKAKYERARTYAQAVIYLLDRNIDENAVPKFLKDHGGIDGVLDLQGQEDDTQDGAEFEESVDDRSPRPMARRVGDDGGARKSDVDDDVDERAESNNKNDSGDRRSSDAKNGDTTKKARRRRDKPDEQEVERQRRRARFHPDTQIAVEAEEYFTELFEMTLDDTLDVRIRCVGDSDTWKRFEIAHVFDL